MVSTRAHLDIELYIGIDPGVQTGIAVWNKPTQELFKVEAMSIIEAMEKVNNLSCFSVVEVRFEDARLRKWFGKKEKAGMQGVGSIKRDCAIWEQFCRYHGLNYKAIAPKDTITKMPADQFRKLTGWQGRTNCHGRDAALLVYGI